MFASRILTVEFKQIIFTMFENMIDSVKECILLCDFHISELKRLSFLNWIFRFIGAPLVLYMSVVIFEL